MVSVLLQALAQQRYAIVQGRDFAFLLHNHPLLFGECCLVLEVLRLQVFDLSYHSIVEVDVYRTNIRVHDGLYWRRALFDDDLLLFGALEDV